MKLNYSLVVLLVPVAALVGCLPASRSTVSAGAGNAAATADARIALERSRTEPSLGHDRQKVLAEAERWLGVPYRFGGSSPSGVDCSAFVCNIYQTVDRVLPRTSTEQSQSGLGVPLSESRPGDLVFFNTSGEGVSHVGILIGPDQFVHASTSVGVTVSSLNEPYYRARMMFVRRVLP
jgi:cell wall-associated NlpC family hydrolase